MKLILCPLLMMSLAAAMASCSDSSSSGSPPQPPGVTFTYPKDGQVDVPTGARMIFQFTDAVDAEALTAPCTMDGDAVRGAFCLVGPRGLVAISSAALGPSGNIVAVSSSELRAGERYQIFVRPGLVPGASNLRDDAPLVTFRTRRSDSTVGVPQLLSVSGEDPGAFVAGGPPLTLPLLDQSTLRLVFSEGLDEHSVALGQSVVLRRAGSPAGPATPATVLVQGPHLTIDPTEDLEAGVPYELVLTGLTDRTGTALPTTALTFTPAASARYEQTVEIDLPGSSTGAGSVRSTLTGAVVNSVVKRSPLIGTAELGIAPGALRVELGDPKAFGGPIPFTLRKGQRLGASELALKLAGIVGLGYQTGALHFDLLTDANGWMTRNAYRPSAAHPDDVYAPLLVDLFFDAALTAEDPTGNALATQTLLNIHLIGTASSSGGQLVLEAAGAIEVELLGVTRANTDISLRMRTGAIATAPQDSPPHILSTSPAHGDLDVALDSHVQVLLSGAVDLGEVMATGELALSSPSGNVPIDIRAAGAALLVVPRQPLAPNTSYGLRLGSLVDVNGLPLALAATDATAGTGVVTFTTAPTPGGSTVPPQLAAILPGAPCALTGGSGAAPGHCVGGAGGDPSYQPFELAADRPIEAHFSQPISAATMKLGTACGRGAIRVEELDAGGACVQVVPGELTLLSNGFRFLPTDYWIPDHRYRVTLVSGADNSCGTDEICGSNGRPFNPDPLNGAGGGGGPAVVIPFTARPATTETVIPLAASPISDRNANGSVDAGEATQVANRFAVEVASTSGIVTDATVLGTDCLPAMAGKQVCVDVATDLPVTVLPALQSCPVDETGAASTSAGPCVPIRVSAQGIRTTELSLEASASILSLTVHTGMMHLRVLEKNPAGAVGYILNASDGKPVFVISVATLMDAPDLSILGGVVSHDVNSKAVNLVLTGPVSFLADGRMQVLLHNRGAVTIPINISALGLDGRINLRVPDGTLSLTLHTPALR